MKPVMNTFRDALRSLAKPSKKDFIIAGIRPNNEAVYLCEGTTGIFWCENAQDIAKGFPNEAEAQKAQDSLGKIYTGLQLETYPRLKAG